MKEGVDKSPQQKLQTPVAPQNEVSDGGEQLFQFKDKRSLSHNVEVLQKKADGFCGKNETAQLQGLANNYSNAVVQPKKNNTGLPDGLKTGIESLSGISMDDVQVHRNSGKPAQLNAHAYAQGNQIHLAPGQEKHLPHEAWHVVQQKQGRVKPTKQLKGTKVNDDSSLEKEADAMGGRANSSNVEQITSIPLNSSSHNKNVGAVNEHFRVTQRKIGMEIEVQADIVNGTVRQHDEDEPLLADSSRRKGKQKALEQYDDFEPVYGKPSYNDTNVITTQNTLTKGQEIYRGNGWKLTPDGHPPQSWYIEFITDAVDEAINPDDLEGIVSRIQGYYEQIIMPLGRNNYTQLTPNIAIGWFHRDAEPSGNIQVTGGVRPDRIFEIMERISKWPVYGQNESWSSDDDEGGSDDEESKSLVMDPVLSNIIGTAVTIAKTQSVNPNYRGLVALLASYVAGQQLAQGPLPTAKLNVPLLSRSKLRNLAKVTPINNVATFIGDVLESAGLEPGSGNTPLFPSGLNVPIRSNRTIERDDTITIANWIRNIVSPGLSFEKTWTDNNMKMEKVGPVSGTICCCIPVREKGIVLEIRAFSPHEYGVPMNEWPKFAREITAAFIAVNRLNRDG